MTDLIERVAKSDAEFDGRTWEAMPAADRKRYLARAGRGISLIRDALLSPTVAMTERAVEAYCMWDLDASQDNAMTNALVAAIEVSPLSEAP